LRHRTESTDLLVEGNQVVAELLEAMKLGDFFLGFAQGDRIGETLRHRLARDATGEAKLRIMSRVVVFGTVAGRLATTAGYGGDGTGSQISQAEELL